MAREWGETGGRCERETARDALRCGAKSLRGAAIGMVQRRRRIPNGAGRRREQWCSGGLRLEQRQQQ